jgi:hypothetical protein
MHVKSRTVRIAGVRVAPDGAWMKQVARNLLDPTAGFLREARYLIHDRDPLFTEAWTALRKTAGVTCVPIPAQSPNCNAYAERFVRTVRNEWLNHLVIFRGAPSPALLREFVEHYLTERYHPGIGGRIIQPHALPSNDYATLARVECRSRLGGVLNFYRRAA